MEGFEPPRLAAQEPKSCVSPYSTTSAVDLLIIHIKLGLSNGYINSGADSLDLVVMSVGRRGSNQLSGM